MATSKTRTDRDETEETERSEMRSEGFHSESGQGRGTVPTAKKQYLIAARRGSALRMAGLPPLSAVQMSGIVRQLPGVEIERVIRSRRDLAALGASTPGTEEANDVYLVRMEMERAEGLRQTLPPQFIVEENAALRIGRSAPNLTSPISETWKLATAIKPTHFTIQVLGAGDRPLRGAAVALVGEGFPAQGITDEKGQVQLDLIVPPGGRVRSLYVTAQSGHWDRYIEEPEISESGSNPIRLQSVQETYSSLPESSRVPWGVRAMGLDKLEGRLSGEGVKIAVIDSGVDSSHPQLKHITTGIDLTNGEDASSWKQDLLGHGSLCAGTIAARNDNPVAFRGFAPEAEVFVLKIFPGGKLSTLIEALDLCIQRRIDLVNLSLVSDQPSLVLAQKLEECILNGVACVAAAGSTGGRVQFPASSPYVLAVGALGRLGEFPAGTWESQTVQEVDPREGFFSPHFTCVGPEVDVCAPGVGVISTAPGGDYNPQSGTSMAAPHVTGLAALLLAHHPLFTHYLTQRGPQRVASLFQMIRSISAPYLFSPGRVGAGMPRVDLIAHQLVAKPGNAEVSAQQTGGAEVRSIQAAQAARHEGLGLASQGLGSFALAARSDVGPMLGAFAPQGVPGLGPVAYVVPSFFYPWLIPSQYHQ